MKNPLQTLLDRKSIKRDLVRKDAYTQVFKSDSGELKPDAELVLAHLREFCFARYTDQTTVQYDSQGRIDTEATLVAQGRHEVWNVIRFFLNVPEVDLVEADRYATRQLQAVQNRELDS